MADDRKSVGVSTGVRRSIEPAPAKWNKWKFIPACNLWKAVCLTLDIEPEDERHNIASWLKSRRGVPYKFPSEFADRLEIAQANMSTNGPIRPQRLYSGVLQDPRAEVLLSDVAAFAIKCEWPIPEAMRDLTRTELAVPKAGRTEQQARALRAMSVPLPEGVNSAARLLAEARDKESQQPQEPTVTKRGFLLKKRAMISKHAASWQTIEADFNHASENGLSEAAKAPVHGEWYEAAALAWAEKGGKLATEGKTPARASIFDLPGWKHKG